MGNLFRFAAILRGRLESVQCVRCSLSFSIQEIEEFKMEALELLEVAEKSLLALDQGGDFRSSFDGIFRGFHNLKGGAGMMEMPKLSAHTHELENILMGFKSGPSIPKEYLNLFLRGIDAARSLLNGKDVSFDFSVSAAGNDAKESAETVPAEASQSTTKDLPESAIGEFLAESEEIVERVSQVLQLLEFGTFSKEDIDKLYRDIHSLKGAAYLFSYADLGNLAHAMESSLEGVRSGTHKPSKVLINALFRGVKLIDTILERLKNKMPYPKISAAIPTLAKVLAVAAERLEPVTSSSSSSVPVTSLKISPDSQVSAASSSTPEPSPSMREPAPLPQKVADTSSATDTASEASSAHGKEMEGASTIRVPVSLLDSLMTLMGEMVLVRNQVLQYSNKSEDREFLSMSKRLNVVTSEIQGEMMKTRMQPIGNILSKFHRVVRDLSHDLGKNIVLNLTGAETELDKSLLEAIKDPLTHIVRNSCDHGIESKEDRKKAGKPQQGTIQIKAYHEGGQVVVDISDDGKGLRKEVILKKAQEKGLLMPGQEAKLSEKEIFNLIFAPGFSTAEKITNVSGRGVGMDVVRTNIEKIAGTVDLSSVPGHGTTIKIKIPLTLAIVPALIVKSGKATFAVPQVKLLELVRVDQSGSGQKIEMLHGTPVLRLRGMILPLVELNSVLELASGKTYEEGVYNIAILNAEQGSFGLIIDEIQDTADIVVKPLNRLLKSLQVYSGATVLGDGSIALILDVTGLAKVAKINQERASEQEELQRSDIRKKFSDSQDYLLLELNSPTKHAIVLGYVHRLEVFPREVVEFSGKQRVIRYGKVILPLISANHELGYGDRSHVTETISVVVIERAGSLYGIEVDSIVDTFSTQVELDPTPLKQKGLFGNLNTKDALYVVVNPFDLISEAFPSSVPGGFGKSETRKSTSSDFIPIHTSGRKLRVLLVEDTVFFRKAIRSVLEKTGYEVVTADNGKEAIDILSRNDGDFDVIVSDIEMPLVNGFQFALAVKKEPNLASIPMLAISSRADNAYVSEGKKAGFDMYLEKFKPNILVDSLADLISRKREAA